jgi:rod shape-determining protein MreD
MKFYKIIFLFIIIPPAQVLLKHILGNEAVYYDLYMILIIYLSIILNMVVSMYLASLAGVIKDLLSAPVVGLNGFSFPLLALASNFIFGKFPVKKIYSQFAIIFFLTIINNLIVGLIALIFGIKITHPAFLEHFYMGLANGLLFILIYNLKKLIPDKSVKKKSRYAV